MPVAVTNLRSSTDGTEPYLESLDASTSAEVVALEWASYLVEGFGVAGALRALQYYEDAGWISRSVRRAMVNHVQSSPEADHGDGPTGAPSETMESLDGTPFEDHARSLEYVAAIADGSLTAELQALRLPATADPTGAAGGTPAAAADPDPSTADGEAPDGAATATDGDDTAADEDDTAADAPTDTGRDAIAADGDDTDEDATETADAATDPSEPAAGTATAATARAGVAGSLADAETFHLLAADADRSRCGMLDGDSETTPDVAETLPREEARAAGLSLCTHCGDSDGE